MDKYSKRYGQALVKMMMYKNNFGGGKSIYKRYLFLPYFYYCKLTWKIRKIVN